MSDSSDLYKIGTVAKLTGIAVERLRAWERRYGLTPASREGKTRYFSGVQVERLTRIKRLIDQGHPVSTLINLEDDALNERLQKIVDRGRDNAGSITASGASSNASPNSHAGPSVGLAGTQLLMLEQTLAEQPRVNVIARWVNLQLAVTDLSSETTSLDSTPDVLVVLLGSVSPNSLEELDGLPATTKPVVVYHYATEQGLEEAREREWQLLRWPAQWQDIEQAIARQAKSPLQAGQISARRFSDEQLLSIASAGSGLGCACPADLVHLISALNAFSDHSQACSGRAVPGRAGPRGAASERPEAALRHANIAERTSQARLELELVLEDWVLAEELLPTPN